ncbi:divalent-cation tolerance protein CutA [Leptolyngbya sp. 15MV]|nr:divalent-cation tolerance protein CutA [Leptolyngbya sp. 15MV]
MSALIWCPFPDRAAAERVAGRLLDEKLVACANLIDGVASLFAWNGERGGATECGALFKTDAAVLDRAVARLEALHPYDAPAVMGWRVDVPGRATAQWLAAETGPD